MNPIETGVRKIDSWQQKHRIPGFAFAVFKKFGDDQAGNLVALLTYYAFLATFPLLLILSAILGLVLKGNMTLQTSIQTSALAEFPIIGAQLKSQIGIASLGHSTLALIIGIVGALLGARGLANALQNALNSLWSVPKINRPGFPSSYLRSLSLLGLLGVGTVVTTAGTWLVGASHMLGITGVFTKILAITLSTAIDFFLFMAAFRIAAAATVSTRNLFLSAILSSVVWQVLLSLAGMIISHYLKHAQAIAGFFGIVLGLLAWFGLQATTIIYAIEADVVRARRLWPRSIVQPPLTSADKQYLIEAVEVEKRRPEQVITVEFTP